MADKFTNCFIDQHELFHYEIKLNDSLLATAHSLTAHDQSIIEEKSVTKSISVTGMSMDINTNRNKLWTVKQALDTWVLDRKLDIESLSMLGVYNGTNLLDYLYNAVLEHEEMVKSTVAGNEKN